MTWHPPVDEMAWSEMLSACLDGELSPVEMDALEQHLKTDAKHAADLAQMRRLRSTLRQWTAPTLAPSPAFMMLLEAARPRPKRPAWPLFAWPHWGFAMALYALGLFSGAGVMLTVRPVPDGTTGGTEQLAPLTTTATNPSTAMIQTPAASPTQMHAVNSTTLPAMPEAPSMQSMTPDQADALLREMQASALANECLLALRRGDRTTALSLAETLQSQYPESRALQALRENTALQWSVRLHALKKGL